MLQTATNKKTIAVTTSHETSTRTLRAFFALTFALTWGLAVLLILFSEQVEAIFGPLSMTNPVFILAVYSPGFASLFLVWRHYGLTGLGKYLRRLAMVRMPAQWWVFLAAGVPALFYTAALFKGTLGEPLPFDPWYGILPALAIALFLGPIEELGWRGMALPLLQRRYTPLAASLILGVIWAVWHAPAFLLSGTPQSAWSFGPYFIAVVSLSVIITPMFNAAHGSILIAALFHFQANGPAWPDAQPWDTVTFGLAALVIVILNRKRMMSQKQGITELLPGGDSSGHSAPNEKPADRTYE